MRAVLTWDSNVKEPPLKFTPVLKRSPLDWALPRVPLPAGGLGDLAGLRESCLVDLYMRLVAAGEEKEHGKAVVVDATFVDETGCRVSLGLWRDDAKLAAANVGKIFYAYDVLVNPGSGDAGQSVLEKLNMLPTSHIHVPNPSQHTREAQLLLTCVLLTEGLRDMAPFHAVTDAEAEEATTGGLNEGGFCAKFDDL